MSTCAISVHPRDIVHDHSDRRRDHRERGHDRHDRYRLEFEQSDSRTPYHHKASTIHGWVTKLRGTLSGNETVRSAGMREMRHAARIREYKRKQEREQCARDGHGEGFLSRILSGPSSRPKSSGRRPSTRHTSSSHQVSRQHTHRSHRLTPEHTSARPEAVRKHSSQRSKPHHYGHGTAIRGTITRDQQLLTAGREMHDRAARERHRERRRRR